MLLVVTDVESTGLGETDQVCELAMATMRPENPTGSIAWWSTLIRPTCPMSVGARATHHISDAELAGAPTMTELLLRRGLPEYGHLPDGTHMVECLPSDVVFVAHNVGYDRRMLVQSGVHPDLLPQRTICTWRCALHLYPDAPGYKNQELRYYLGVEPAFAVEGPPHRALPDVAVTSGVVLRMLETETPECLIELTQLPVLLKTVRFGQYSGRPWSDMDAGWLRWVLAPERKFGEDERHTAQHWLDQRLSPKVTVPVIHGTGRGSTQTGKAPFK